VRAQVRFAKETNKVQPTIAPNDQNMLFFARAPLKATEDDIKTAFGKHGEVRSLIPSPFLTFPPPLSEMRECGLSQQRSVISMMIGLV
jgi:hypothetical protein